MFTVKGLLNIDNIALTFLKELFNLQRSLSLCFLKRLLYVKGVLENHFHKRIFMKSSFSS